MTQAQKERSQRRVQNENDIGDLCRTEAREGIARRLFKVFLEDSEAATVSERELQEQVLSPIESGINTVRADRNRSPPTTARTGPYC